jgi:sigma-E factor negative regulatory protein RseA
MTEKLREMVSALTDDEVPSAELELLLRRISRDPELKACWGRYQLIGECVRGDIAASADLSLADRVRAALEDEPVATPGMPAWLKSAAGLAIAASVAMVAVFTLQPHETGTSAANAPSEVVPMTASSLPGATPVNYGNISGVRWNQGPAEVQTQLNNFLVNHNEYAGGLGRQGMLPYMHIAAYDSQVIVPPQRQAQPRGAGEARVRSDDQRGNR